MMKVGVELSKKELRFLQGIASGMLPKEAAAVAGYKAAHQSSVQLLQRPIVKSALLVSHGALSEALARSDRLLSKQLSKETKS